MKELWQSYHQMQDFLVESGIRPIAGGSGELPPPGEEDDDTDAGPEPRAGEGNDEGTGEELDPDILKALRQEAAKYRTRSRDAVKKLEEAEKRLRELDDKDKSESERLRGENENLQERLQKSEERVNELTLENALATSEHRFHDAQDALALLNRELLEEDDDGGFTTHSVNVAITALAKSKPHLLKSDKEEDPKGSSSGGVTGNKGGRKGEIDQEALLAKYPALRNRVPVR